MKIALSGKMRSGKDTIGDYLVDNHNFNKYSFAKSLKKIGNHVFGFTKESENGRMLLQELGKFGRLVDENFWVERTLDEIQDTLSDNIVITDMRFENEAEHLKREGFILIRINAPHEDCVARGASCTFDISEIDLDNYDDFDYIINNDGSLEELYKKIDKVIESETINR